MQSSGHSTVTDHPCTVLVTQGTISQREICERGLLTSSIMSNTNDHQDEVCREAAVDVGRQGYERRQLDGGLAGCIYLKEVNGADVGENPESDHCDIGHRASWKAPVQDSASVEALSRAAAVGQAATSVEPLARERGARPDSHRPSASATTPHTHTPCTQLLTHRHPTAHQSEAARLHPSQTNTTTSVAAAATAVARTPQASPITHT